MPRVRWTCLENVTQGTCETLHVVIELKHGDGLVYSVGLIWQGPNPGRGSHSLQNTILVSGSLYIIVYFYRL